MILENLFGFQTFQLKVPAAELSGNKHSKYMTESASIKAIELTRKVFEHIHGNLGLLKFNVEELIPTNGTDTEESKKWDIICSFYETLVLHPLEFAS